MCHVSHRLQIRPSGQRSPPPSKALLGSRWGSRWDQLPPANRQRLLRLLGHLVERQLSPAATSLPAGREEITHDLHC